MRRYLVDTGPLAAYLHGRPALSTRLNPFSLRDELATSVLVYAEVNEYLLGLPNAHQWQQALRTLLGAVHPYSLTYPILNQYGTIRRQLRSPHGPGLIGDIDTLIAATALERDLTVITMDSDFQRVPGLSVLLLPRRN